MLVFLKNDTEDIWKMLGFGDAISHSLSSAYTSDQVTTTLTVINSNYWSGIMETKQNGIEQQKSCCV